MSERPTSYVRTALSTPKITRKSRMVRATYGTIQTRLKVSKSRSTASAGSVRVLGGLRMMTG